MTIHGFTTNQQTRPAPGRGTRRALRSVVRLLAIGVAVVTALVLTGGLAAADPGAHHDLRGTVRKTIFNVEVARVRIHVDAPTQARLGTLTHAGKPSADVARLAVRTVLSATRATITTEFMHDVPYDSYLESAYESLQEASEAGLISPAVQRATAQLLPTWFAGLGGRGPREGDRLACSVGASSVRLVYTTAAGKKLVDQTVRGRGPGRAILASYFIPGSDLEEELVESLFR